MYVYLLYLIGGVLALGAGTVFPRHMARAFGSPCVCPLCMEPRSLGTGRTVRRLATLCVCRLHGVILWIILLLPALSLTKDYAILGFETCILVFYAVTCLH